MPEEVFIASDEQVQLSMWFTCLGSAEEHNKQWRARFLCALCLGIQTGVWQEVADCPLWGR
eukprot:11225488-Lingulodinium_polyedra.AAC.1